MQCQKPSAKTKTAELLRALSLTCDTYILNDPTIAAPPKHKVPKSVLRTVLRRMQFTLHATPRTPHGASRLVQAMPAWLVKTRRGPSRHSRDARVCGHTTTAMHRLSTPPPYRIILFLRTGTVTGTVPDIPMHSHVGLVLDPDLTL